MNRCSLRVSLSVLLLAALLLAALVAGGCGPGEQVKTAPPEGWQADGARWWTEGADTAAAFRNLSSVRAMGVLEGSPVFAASSGDATDEQIMHAAKKGLQKLYRKAPETVDSLFAEYVAPKVADLPRNANMQARMTSFSEKSHELITEHFYPPTQLLRLGKDIPVSYPDSLRDQGGSVWMQVRVSAEGEPKAIKLIEGAHPVLNDVVRRAVTQMKWEPARVRSGDYGWHDIPSWTWVNVSLS